MNKIQDKKIKILLLDISLYLYILYNMPYPMIMDLSFINGFNSLLWVLYMYYCYVILYFVIIIGILLYRFCWYNYLTWYWEVTDVILYLIVLDYIIIGKGRIITQLSKVTIKESRLPYSSKILANHN